MVEASAMEEDKAGKEDGEQFAVLSMLVRKP